MEVIKKVDRGNDKSLKRNNNQNKIAGKNNNSDMYLSTHSTYNVLHT